MLTVPSMPALPRELVDYIIDFLHNDKRSLRRCSLVHRVCLPACSFHLFRHLRWPPCRCNWDQHVVESGYTCRCRHLVGETATLAHFKEVLRTTPRICDNVRDLHITVMAWFEPESSRRQRFARSISPLEIAEILDLTPRVESLVLGGMEFVPGASGLAPKPSMRALHTLRLVAPSSDLNLQQILDLLAHFTRISTLSLRNIEPMLDLPTSLTPPAHLIKVEHLELSFRLAETGAIWLDRICAHIDASTITSLTVHDVVSLHDDDAMAPAFHQLLSRCTALKSITIQDFVYRGLLSYPSTHTALRELRFIGSLSYDSTGVRSSLRDSIGESMNSTLGSTVQELFCELKVINDILQDESDLDASALEGSFRRMLEVLDWPVLDAVVAQLRSLKISMKLELRKTVTVQTLGTSLRRSEGFSISIRSEQREWPGDADVYRSILESVVRNRVTLSADQHLDLRVSFSSVSR